jgi:hypothetical protein
LSRISEVAVDVDEVVDCGSRVHASAPQRGQGPRLIANACAKKAVIIRLILIVGRVVEVDALKAYRSGILVLGHSNQAASVPWSLTKTAHLLQLPENL